MHPLPRNATSFLAAFLVVAACGDGTAAPDGAPMSIRANQIVFVSARTGETELFVINDDGSGEQQITRSSLEGRSDPAVSPDGTKIAYTMWAPDVSCPPTYFTCGHEIYVAHADGSGERRLTNNEEQDGHPAWSPDGTQIAFAGARSGTASIFVMTADGTGTRQITSLAGWNDQPAWSPDGTRIAFTRGFSNADGLYIVNASGSGVFQLTSFGEWPAWSPDGSRIAYRALGGIAAINPDGTGAAQLTSGSFDQQPAWSPDGSRIAFASGYDDIWVVNADGSGRTRLTSHQAQDHDPSWGQAP